MRKRIENLLAEYNNLKAIGSITIEEAETLVKTHFPEIPEDNVNGLAISLNRYSNAHSRVANFDPLALPLTESHPTQKDWTEDEIESLKTQYKAELETEEEKFTDEIKFFLGE